MRQSALGPVAPTGAKLHTPFTGEPAIGASRAPATGGARPSPPMAPPATMGPCATGWPLSVTVTIAPTVAWPATTWLQVSEPVPPLAGQEMFSVPLGRGTLIATVLPTGTPC